MQLIEELGNFVQLSDIPSNSLIWEKSEAYIPLTMLNTMYDVCIGCLRGKRIDTNMLSTDIQYESASDAVKGFKLFNIVQDVDTIVHENVQKNILKPVPIHADVTHYIKKTANKYLRYRRQQLDCGYILTAFDSELYLFTNSADIPLDVPYTSCTNFRSTAKPNKRTYIFNEVEALKSIKLLFAADFNRLKQLIHELQVLSLKFRGEKVPCSDIDLEL